MDKPISNLTLTNQTLVDLFLAMAMKEESRIDAEKAFTAFYNHYSDFLYSVIKRVCKSWEMYGDELIESVFNNTFTTVFNKADTFLSIDNVPFEKQEMRLKAWLCQIARNEMFQILRKSRLDKEKIEYFDDLSFIDSIEIGTDEIVSYDILLVEKALQTLNERDRNILTTYLMFEDSNKKLPHSEIQRLAEMWNVLPDNLRQIKKRSIEKIKKYILTNKIK